jgi:hypothetical protein
VPRDIFKPDNSQLSIKYLKQIDTRASRWLRFTDKKCIGGAEMFKRKAQPDPLTGVTPENVVDQELLVRDQEYSQCDQFLLGFDEQKPPV